MMQFGSVGRRGALRFLSGVAVIGAATTIPAYVRAAGRGGGATISDGTLTIEFDTAMRSRLSRGRQQLTGFDGGDALRLVDGDVIDRFLLLDHVEAAAVGPHGPGRRHALRATASGRVELQMAVTMLDRYPGMALIETTYRNTGKTPLVVAGWRSATHDVLAHPDGAWTFAGASYSDRRDWIQPVTKGFDQRNFMGMNASDYGGGTPVAVAWRRDGGVAVGHIETVPRLVSLPVTAQPTGTRIGMSGDQPSVIAPGGTLVLPTAFVMVHEGDHFRPLDTYRRVMAERGVAAAAVPAASYAPTWCAWGYERNFTTDQVIGTLPKAKSLGLEWAVLDDGWQTSEGDWKVDRKKFPRGGVDIKAFADDIKAQGMKARLWLAPLAVDPGTDLMRDHPEMLLLNQDGAAQNVSFWDAYTLCPAYQPVVDHFRTIVRRIVGEWGFEGLKLDGQHLNGVAPCYNPAHRHARPEESIEKLQDFWKAMHDEAIAANPQAVVEICPCGDSFAFHNLPATNSTPASDPLSSWQIRLKGKTFKAMMGPQAPYAGDHVELSDGGNDFASSYGIGAVLSTKFTWPRDNPNPMDPPKNGGFLLTPERETLWRKWIGMYRENMLPTGDYLGGLYDIGFDKPEGHAVAKGGALHYAFYAPTWKGPIALRGLGAGSYTLTDGFTGKPLGSATAAKPTLQASFEQFLLVVATPAGRAA